MKWHGSARLLLCAHCRIASGNLIFDGVHAFQYDAWGRVVQINRAHLEPLIETNFTDPPSEPFPFTIAVDELVKHYTYDAFGRLIRVQSPWPEPGEWSQDLRSERLYYDGLRRVQEINIDPLLPMSMAPHTLPSRHRRYGRSATSPAQ